MNATQIQATEILLQVIRGERPWQDLQPLGIKVVAENGRRRLENPGGVTATADIRDLARGLLAHRSVPGTLREWAFVMEAADLDLDVKGHPAGDAILNAVWGASFGESIPDEVFRTAEGLVQTNGSLP